ncbi:hypothetical protein [Neobacillus mesonae]|uniref:hypothetical protein n=1 Tax=Neobacillus mesonae TaxID=1193713 RepID=UPI00203AC159|nr:hypothetical protein [Neobacillus mesonae]MCM3567780.1 hypothetical protein [Neobacillus mesonae]
MTNMNVAGKKNQAVGQQIADHVIHMNPIGIVFEDDSIDIPTIKIKRNIHQE